MRTHHVGEGLHEVDALGIHLQQGKDVLGEDGRPQVLATVLDVRTRHDGVLALLVLPADERLSLLPTTEQFHLVSAFVTRRFIHQVLRWFG